MKNGDKKINFVISVFGKRYIGMLIGNTFSISRSNPNAKISIFYQDIDEEIIQIIAMTFPQTEFTKTNFNFSTDHISRIASKTIMWNYAINCLDSGCLVFLDVDMLVLKDISPFFQDEFDVLYTTKIKENCQLNTGIMLVYNTKKVALLFKSWMNRAIEIINNSELFRKSVSSIYGAPDQMALIEIINFNPINKRHNIKLLGQEITLKSEECKILNETNSTSISKFTHVVHYKGGWQNILIDGFNFTKKRPKNDSWEMYIYYIKNYKEALHFIFEKTGKDIINEKYIKIPFYLNDEIKENKLLYWAYYIMSALNHFSLKLKRKVIKKLSINN